jgi:hypothetical protein
LRRDPWDPFDPRELDERSLGRGLVDSNFRLPPLGIPEYPPTPEITGALVVEVAAEVAFGPIDLKGGMAALPMANKVLTVHKEETGRLASVLSSYFDVYFLKDSEETVGESLHSVSVRSSSPDSCFYF